MEIYHNKKHRTKSWIEKIPKPKEDTSETHNKEKKSARGNLLNYPSFHHSILFLHIKYSILLLLLNKYNFYRKYMHMTSWHKRKMRISLLKILLVLHNF